MMLLSILVVVGCSAPGSTGPTAQNAESPGNNLTNSPPSISGAPNDEIIVGDTYSFTPITNDPNDDPLTFNISRRPPWASFDDTTGSISGTPDDNDVGTYDGISVSVSDGMSTSALPEFKIEVAKVGAGPTANSAPVISGSPRRQVNANGRYDFTATASDADGDNLTFSVSRLPGWARFNDATGRISGTPGDADVGIYDDVTISVSDGTASDTLAPYSITVNAVSLGSVTLNWTPPTKNEDGTALTDLAGYKIYWGTTSGSYPNSTTIKNSSISSYVIDSLAPGTYEFVAASFNAAGVESAYSNVAVKTVSPN